MKIGKVWGYLTTLAVFFATLALLATPAMAATLTATCSPNPAAYLGQSGGGVEMCSMPTAPNGHSIVSATVSYIVDIQYDGFGPLPYEAGFGFDAPGTSADWAGTVTQANRPLASGPMAIAPGEWGLLIGQAFSVVDTYTGASVAITGATFTKLIQAETRPEQGGDVPEPGSFALVGGVLLALGANKVAFRRPRERDQG